MLDTSLGYMLKAAASALHSAMEAVLRPLGMTITHYACLELLAQRPGLSNSELARGAFVTRQSMNVLLQALERQGFVVRPAQAPVGRALPTELTARGRRQLKVASAAVRRVEQDMLANLDTGEHLSLRGDETFPTASLIKVAILVEDEYNIHEFWYPYYRFKEAGAEVKVVGPSKAAQPCDLVDRQLNSHAISGWGLLRFENLERHRDFEIAANQEKRPCLRHACRGFRAQIPY